MSVGLHILEAAAILNPLLMDNHEVAQGREVAGLALRSVEIVVAHGSCSCSPIWSASEATDRTAARAIAGRWSGL